MVDSWNKEIISLVFCPNPLPKGSGNYLDLDKTWVKNYSLISLVTIWLHIQTDQFPINIQTLLYGLDTFYGPLSARIKNVRLHNIFMNTSEQTCWNNLPHMIIIN